MKELMSAFVKAQAMIVKATKDSTNPHFKSKYADLESVVDAIKPALAANGLAFIQKFHDDDKGVKIETVIVHESGDAFSCGILSIPATKQDAQGFGSAATYARRYSLQAAFGVAPEDDDGNAASKAQKLPAVDINAAVDEMNAAADLETLKGIFARYYKVAAPAQKPVLKAIYDGIKETMQETANA